MSVNFCYQVIYALKDCYLDNNKRALTSIVKQGVLLALSGVIRVRYSLDDLGASLEKLRKRMRDEFSFDGGRRDPA